MGVTPMDIQNKEFERAFRGYDIEDVDEFLDRVAKDLEQLIRENMDLKEQVGQLADKNKNYHKLEETMHNAIVVAQETAEEVKHTAKREADLIRREADRDAQRIVEDARYRSSKILNEQEDLFKQAQVFKMRFRSFIEAQLASLESEDWMERPEEKRSVPENKPEFDQPYSFEPKQEFSPKQEFDTRTALEPDPLPEPSPAPEPEQKLDQDTELDFDSKRYFDSVLDDEPDREVDF